MKALLSVYNKTGIVEFAQELINLGWGIISSGGTAAVLKKAGLAVQDIAEITGRGPILDHRVVTLAPEIHGGLLATAYHTEELEKLGFPFIGLACVDLYPLKEAIRKPEATAESVIENTDIGGPTLLRSAAKGRRIVIADPADRPVVIQWLKDGRPNNSDFIASLAAKAEGIVAEYCLESARYHSGGKIDGFVGTQVAGCRYGENPYQTPAALFAADSDDPLALHRFELVGGEGPSLINFTDVDCLVQTITHIAAGFDVNFGTVPCIAVGVKHGNACGAAVSKSPCTALERMLDGDLVAIFGGFVITNFPIGSDEAAVLRHYGMHGEAKRMLDGVIAPSFSEEAIEALARTKTGKCRMFRNPALGSLTKSTLDRAPRFRQVRGGFLRQPNYTFVLDLAHPELEVTGAGLEDVKGDMVLAWGVGSTSVSNTITLALNGQLIGNAVGQQSRVDAARLALDRARNHVVTGAVGYSDSFFPEPDGPQTLVSAGIGAVFASRGSVKDAAVKKFFSDAMVLFCTLPDKVCRGFYRH